MATEKRINLFTDAETTDWFAPPIFDTNDKPFLFTLAVPSQTKGLAREAIK